MVFSFSRSLSGLILLLFVSFFYVIKKDLIFFLLIFSLFFYDFHISNLVNINFLYKLIFFIFVPAAIFFLLYPSYIAFLLFIYYTIVICSLFASLNYKNIFFLFSLVFFMYFFFFSLQYDRSLIYLIIFISFFNDTAAYLFGNLLKGPKIIPKISPNKTWSGTVLSFIFTSIILFIFDFNLFLSILAASMFFFGDLYFSHIKRSNKLKDFSNLLPGHGGILDRFDSIIFPFIIIFTYNFL